ncbi:MAG: class I SAM-dependent methyltransferase [Firmicutes bacterium HGW-Firmicutes-7]|nr:MAG: class I SAM-dependent methyltransferase [Firmicutes bacterium HGW-Firmicutes-7]
MSQKCILCESQTKVIQHRKSNVDYHYCKECEFISKDNNAIISLEEEFKIYNYHINSIEDTRYVDYFYEFLNDAVFKYVNRGKKGLDFGSGPSPVLAQILERYHGYNMDIYDIFYSPQKVYLKNKYDLVTCTEVIEHLKNPLEYFKLFKELLIEDGVLSIMTQFHHNDDAHFLNWHYIRDESHISFYTPKTMKYIAEQTGLKIIYTNGIKYTTFAIDSQ